MNKKLDNQNIARAKERVKRLQSKQTQQKLAVEIIDIVSEYYNVDLTEDTNSPSVSKPRTTAVYLTKKHAPRVSLEYLGELLGRGHSNFVIQTQRLEDELPYDKQRRKEINELDLIIQVSAVNKKQLLKDSLIIDALNRLNDMNTLHIKNFLEQLNDYLEEINVEYDVIK